MSLTKTMILQPIPYILFDGNCADAMRFYETALGGKIIAMMTGAQSPVQDPMMEAFGDRVMNAQLELPGGLFLYGGDCQPNKPHQGFPGFSITLNLETIEEGEEIFNNLADGGVVTMPFSPTFWAEKFGMLTDKFGVDWIINGNLNKMQ
jgi:PhnB protein